MTNQLDAALCNSVRHDASRALHDQEGAVNLYTTTVNSTHAFSHSPEWFSFLERTLPGDMLKTLLKALENAASDR